MFKRHVSLRGFVKKIRFLSVVALLVSTLSLIDTHPVAAGSGGVTCTPTASVPSATSSHLIQYKGSASCTGPTNIVITVKLQRWNGFVWAEYNNASGSRTNVSSLQVLAASPCDVGTWNSYRTYVIVGWGDGNWPEPYATATSNYRDLLC